MGSAQSQGECSDSIEELHRKVAAKYTLHIIGLNNTLSITHRTWRFDQLPILPLACGTVKIDFCYTKSITPRVIPPLV